MRSHSLRALVATGIAATAVLFGGTTPAQAEASCTSSLMDTTANQVLRGHEAALSASIRKIQKNDGKVRIRVVETIDGSTEDWVHQTMRDCASWRSRDNSDKLPDYMVTVVVAISTKGDYSNRQVGIFTGATAASYLDNEELRQIRTKTMTPFLGQFKHDDPATHHFIADGLNAGLRAMNKEIDRQERTLTIITLSAGGIAILILILVVVYVMRATRSSRTGSGSSRGRSGGGSTAGAAFAASCGSSSSSSSCGSSSSGSF